MATLAHALRTSNKKGCTVTRPFFSAAWAASQEIFDPFDSGGRVARVVGGFVERNINNPDATQRWDNTCAVRMSYILNYAGVVIPRVAGQTVSGADHRQYFFRVRDLIGFLRQRWGAPEVVRYPPSDGGTLAGKQGVVLFEVSGWSDAQGHATLYNGSICYDQCYFNQPGATYRTDQANFWTLP